MTITMSPYLNFPYGETRAAMEFYQSIFGGELAVMGFAEFGYPDMPADGVMHAALNAGPFSLFASDAMEGAQETWKGTRNYIAFMGDELDLMTGWYDKLAADGTGGQPLAAQAWGDIYGDVKDKFGIEWMFNISPTPADDQPS